jgi:DNA-directed RNA polymerase subunit M/transcription elongation factor TFIIS
MYSKKLSEYLRLQNANDRAAIEAAKNLEKFAEERNKYKSLWEHWVKAKPSDGFSFKCPKCQCNWRIWAEESTAAGDEAEESFKQLAQEVEERYKLFDEIKQLDFKSNAIQYERESLWRELDKEYIAYGFVSAASGKHNSKGNQRIQELRRKLGLGEE